MNQGTGIVDLDDQLPRWHRQHRAVESHRRLTTEGRGEVVSEIDADDLFEETDFLERAGVFTRGEIEEIVEHDRGVLGHRGSGDVGVRRDEGQAAHQGRLGEPGHDSTAGLGEPHFGIGGVPITVAMPFDDQGARVEQAQAIHGCRLLL